MNSIRCFMFTKLRLSVLFVATLLVAHSVCARTINVADHGVVPGKDATLALTRLIQSIDGKDNITLLFPKGNYDFYPENAIEKYRAVSNHDNSLKRMIFSFVGRCNLTVDGGGSEFLGRLVRILPEDVSTRAVARGVDARSSICSVGCQRRQERKGQGIG